MGSLPSQPFSVVKISQEIKKQNKKMVKMESKNET